MNFTTKIPITQNANPIDYNSKIVSFGSCFAENMGDKLLYYKFQTQVNPFGIIFNPFSIEKLIERVVLQRYFTKDDIFFFNERWHCYEVHSELSHPYKEEFLNNLNLILETTKNQINSLSHCIITLGTSWVYTNIESNEIVANCHKVPQKHFRKELLSINQTEESLQNIVSLVHSLSPKCHFIFTVSPVRHIKDGFVENTLSKAHLIAAIHSVLNRKFSTSLELTTQNNIYFPAYEIMMDELRDYRFYAEDMLHPSQTAIDYIWIQFFENYISESQFGLMNDICSIQKGLKHRPFNPNTESHQKFLHQLELKIKTIQNQHPFIKFC